MYRNVTPHPFNHKVEKVIWNKKLEHDRFNGRAYSRESGDFSCSNPKIRTTFQTCESYRGLYNIGFRSKG